MKPKAALVAGLTVALVCVAALVVGKHPAARDGRVQTALPSREAAVAPRAELTSPMEKPAALEPLPADAPAVPLDRKAQPVLEEAGAGAKVKPQTGAQANKAAANTQEVIEDPLAREALALVGVDRDAEMYWFAAIHDPTLPTSERQDLIDDLNEEGLPDPKHPTVDDLPLILNRLQALEALVPTITDRLDWEESYDDLLNLVDLAMGGGQPVR